MRDGRERGERFDRILSTDARLAVISSPSD